ncbi:MAG: hypothetical protein HEP80_06255 [Dolichospermum sp. UKL201]|nr:MAG: hypothetical protein HEP80_06255 [Dolichospermum sp. UKL201]
MLVVSCQWSVVSGQWLVVSGQMKLYLLTNYQSPITNYLFKAHLQGVGD